MDVTVVGGGPGGAYAALLLKSNHPDWAVTVYEKSPPAVTYGWGIVLPERIYPTLRAADEPTCERIEARNTRWDPIDTIHRGERVRCGGYPYTSILRTELLEILQERCQDLGVDVRFETEIEDVPARAAESDLVVGADGIHSLTRKQYAGEFGTTLHDGENLFSWFGTERQFDALTHIYVESEDGLWHAGAYPGPTSTFVVTCDPETYRRAGVDEMDEAAYIAYLEDVFADTLDGHDLRSKADRWRPFTTVENETWTHENVALLGDAAHTAHFTIGSGTRMAIEDAIGLSDALEETDDVEAALDRYESERKPHVDALQRAAERSMRHFEHIERYTELDPLPFATLYLTRTGHNTYSDLRERDPSYVDRLERWFAGRAREATTTEGETPGAPLTQPFALGDVTVPNRLVAVPTLDAGDEGEAGDLPDDRRQRALVEAGDIAGLVTATVAVAESGRPDRATPGLYTDDHERAWTETIDRIESEHGEGVCTAARLAYSPGDDTVGVGERAGGDPDVVRAFARAAERAKTAGFDIVEVHAGAGVLRESLLASVGPGSGERNGNVRKSDSAESDGVLAVVEAVDEAWVDGRPLAATLPVVGDEDTSGVTFDLAGRLVEAGCDLLSVGPVVDASADPFALREHSKRVRNEVGVPTVATGPETTGDDVNTALVSGRADLCVIESDAFDRSAERS